jgi:hypothetical protein
MSSEQAMLISSRTQHLCMCFPRRSVIRYFLQSRRLVIEEQEGKARQELTRTAELEENTYRKCRKKLGVRALLLLTWHGSGGLWK